MKAKIKDQFLRIGVVDTETTGLDYETDEIIEIAMTIVDVDLLTGRARIVDTKMSDGIPHNGAFESLANPSRPIPLDSTCVHHIQDADVAESHSTEHVLAAFARRVEQLGVDLLLAHNAAFDRPFVERHTGYIRPWVCTFRLAKLVYEDCPRFSNTYLRYWLGHDLPGGGPVHRALFDTLVTAMTLVRIIADGDIGELVVDKWADGHCTVDDIAEELQARSEEPRLIKHFGFGKHSHSSLTEVPAGYLRWLLATSDDIDVQYSARHELTRRFPGLNPEEGSFYEE